MSKIYTNKEAKEILLKGTKIISDAVLSTYGPNGHNVIVNNRDGRFITKDGVSVAKEINANGTPEDEAIQMLKEACILTNTQAGDGTTTSMLFARTIIEQGLRSEDNGIKIKRDLEKELPLIIEKIDLYKRQCTIEDIEDISNVSTNGDASTTSIVKQVFSNNIEADVIFDKSLTNETSTEFIEGYSTTGSCYNELYDYLPESVENARVYTVDGKITALRELKTILEFARSTDQVLIIIAEAFSSDIEKVIYNNRELINVKLIKSPGYGQGRQENLINIAAYTNQKGVLTPKQFYNNMLFGNVDKFSNKNGRLIFLNNESNKELETRVKYLENKMSSTNDGFEKENLSNLLSKFKSGISIIKIGAKSDIEYRELHDKLEDAVNACKSALKDGIILGGGITAKEVAESISNPILVKTLTSPYTLLGEFDKDYIIENKIYDPAYVLKCAITNAIAVAGTILTTNTIVLNNE